MIVRGLAEFIALTRDVGRDYAEYWKKIAQVYEQHAFYDAIKEAINPASSKLWIDCCCGTGNILIPNQGIVIGFDYNPESLARAKERHSGANYHADYSFIPNGPPFTFTRLPGGGFQARDGINLVFDDIRTMDVVKSGIKEQPDLMTLICPGAPECAKYEGRYAQDFDYKPGNTEQARDRIQKTESIIRHEFFRQAQQILANGGIAVFADRLCTPEGFDLSKVFSVDPEIGPTAEQYGFEEVASQVIERDIPAQEDAQHLRKLYKDQTPLIHVEIRSFKRK